MDLTKTSTQLLVQELARRGVAVPLSIDRPLDQATTRMMSDARAQPQILGGLVHQVGESLAASGLVEVHHTPISKVQSVLSARVLVLAQDPAGWGDITTITRMNLTPHSSPLQ